MHAPVQSSLMNRKGSEGKGEHNERKLMSGELQYIGRRGRGVHGKGGGEDDLPTLPTMAGSYSSTI